MLVVIVLLLMIQLKHFGKTLLILATRPLTVPRRGSRLLTARAGHGLDLPTTTTVAHNVSTQVCSGCHFTLGREIRRSPPFTESVILPIMSMPKRRQRAAPPARIQIRGPKMEDVAEFVRNEKLRGDLTAPLYREITDVAAEIRAAIDQLDFSPEARRARLKQIRDIKRAIEKILEGLRQPVAVNLLRRLLATELGFSLSTAAFEAATRVSIAGRISPRVLESRLAAGRSGPYSALEEAASEERIRLAHRAGEKVLATTLERLAYRLGSYLDLERQHKGGRPPDIYRRYTPISACTLL
jgi:hypothetical protein